MHIQVIISTRKKWIEKDASEEIESHHSSTVVNDHICDENGMNLINT